MKSESFHFERRVLRVKDVSASLAKVINFIALDFWFASFCFFISSAFEILKCTQQRLIFIMKEIVTSESPGTR